MAIILEGRPVAEDVKRQLAAAREKGVRPSLAVIRFGCGEADLSYERSIVKLCRTSQVRVSVFTLDRGATLGEVRRVFDPLNRDRSVDGILVMGSPEAPDVTAYMRRTICRRKDIDAMGLENMAGVYGADASAVLPCTAQAVLRMLEYYELAVSGKRVCVLGRSLIAGRPIALALLGRNATVTVCHSYTQDLSGQTRRAEIIVSAVGRAKFLTGKHISAGAVVIDVGINLDGEGRLCGDADFASVQEVAGAVTPVPNGVGAVTNALLLLHVYHSCLSRKEEE